ncbi:MAG TPA: hypothetical protein VFX79_02935 [Candidatus Saccharimonadales bacterium]|nr:hypothetical protein [Candidatus Saccharimonadales bacterium]
MSPDSEENNNQINPNNNPPAPKDDIPSSPGGVIQPTGAENSPPPAPAADNPSPPPPPSEPIKNELPQNNQTGFASTNPPASPSQSTPSSPGGTQFGPNPAQPGGPEIFPSDPISTAGAGANPSFFKKKLFLIGLPILLVLLIAGYVFGYYIPNKPENVYRTGMNRSGDALEMILNQATERETYDKFKKSEVNATMDINYNNQNINGEFNAKFDETKLDSNLKLGLPVEGSEPINLDLSVLSETADGKEFPDTYLNLKGMKALGADLFLPGISKYEGKWLEISSDYLQSIADQYGLEAPETQDNTEDFPTFDEISSLIRDLYGDTNEYVFTTDPEKAVIENKQYLGKEEVEGTDTFHYEVALNKENYKKYCEAVSNTLASSPTYKKFSGLNDEQIEEQKQKIGEDCQKDADTIKAEDTFEMWIDSKYKLIKKIRIYSEDKKSYFDIGQNYDGTDEVGLFFAFASEEGNFNSKITVTTNLNTAESSGEVTFNGGENEGAYDGKITLSMKSLSGDFEITKPNNTIGIGKLLKELGIDPKSLATVYGGASPASGINAKAGDAETKANVNSIYSNIEVYFAENAIYPTKSQLNDQSWRAANMSGLPADFFSGIEYNPFDCNANGCLKYTLSAKLSDGSTFEKTGSNN